MQLNSIKNCRKKEKRKKRKALLVAKNRGLQLNQVKILRIYPIVYKKKKKKSSQTKFYMQLNSIRNCKKKKLVEKVEDYNLTKQKYFKCKIYNKLLH